MKYIREFIGSGYEISSDDSGKRQPNLPHKGEPISSEGNISILQQDWFEKLLPDQIHLHSNPGIKKLNFDQSLSDVEGQDYTFRKNDCTIEKDLVQFNYWLDKNYKPGEENIDGEPSCVEFDIHFVKNDSGVKLLVDITYGDNMAVEFSIESPNKINVIHYTGVGSLYDSETHWGFSEETILDLTKFFNAFNHGIKITEKDLSFLDRHEDSYQHDVDDEKHLYNDDSDLLRFGNSVKESIIEDIILVIDNSKEPEKKYLPKVLEYLDSRDIDYKVASTTELLQQYNSNYNIIGAISTGSDYRVRDNENTLLNETALDILKCPIIAMCFGFQSMSKHYGSEISGNEEICGKYLIDNWDKNCPIFKGVDLDNQKLSFCFHDYPMSCPEGFSVIAEFDGKIAGISSGDKFGILFHPEEMESTYIILDNFVNMCKPIEQTLKYLETFESFSKKFK